MRPGRSSGFRERAQALRDAIVRAAVRRAVDAVRYQPPQLGIAMACGAGDEGRPTTGLLDRRSLPVVGRAARLPDALARMVASLAARGLGPTAAAIVSWLSGAVAGRANRAGATAVLRPFATRAHPGMLVPHPHDVAVLAVDMRGFSNLTGTLDDTRYLADLIGEYLSELTRIVERHHGVVFQYTGDGLLALFLPELAGLGKAEALERLAHATAPELHEAFDAMYARWREEWAGSGRRGAEIGLGTGLSFGRAAIGLIGPAGRKQFAVIGEPVNLAAFLCSQAPAGTLLVDRDSFGRAGTAPPPVMLVRLRSKKPHQRIETVCLRYGARHPAAGGWLDDAASS
jgi:class 3 adenylate cyclase